MKKILMKVSCPALGDTLCSTPTIRKVSQSYGHKVDVMTRRPDVFRHNPYINNILSFDNDMDKIVDYDEVFETYNRSINIDGKDIDIKLSNFEARQFHAMGVGITLYNDEMVYDFTPDEQTELSKKVTDEYIVLHITENWASRTWSIDKWQKLVDMIKSNTNYKIITIGKAHSESGFHGNIIKDIPKINNIDIDSCLYDNLKSGQDNHVKKGTGSLSELWHIINNAAMLISFDTGPIHLAGTTDTYIIQIGSSIRYEKTAPYRHGSQDYKFESVGGECELFCATDLKYSVKEWGSINTMPYYPECQEKYTEFKCHPSVQQIFDKINEIEITVKPPIWR